MKCKYYVEVGDGHEDYCLCQGELPLSSDAVLDEVIKIIDSKYMYDLTSKSSNKYNNEIIMHNKLLDNIKKEILSISI